MYQYKEIEIIKTVADKKSKVELALIFLEEYGGLLQHLKSVGLKWGDRGEEIGANSEFIKCRLHMNELKKFIISLI
jgi:hypothetical protein